jgi:hypothetical protein
MRVGDYIASAFHINDVGANIPAVIINRIAQVEGNKITYFKSEDFTTTCRRKKMDGVWVCHQSSGFYIRCDKYLTQENLESFLSQQGQEQT